MKLKASIIKEYLILIRDIPGLAILFIMPVALIIVISLAQDTTLQSLKESQIEILFIDNDNDILGKTIKEGLQSAEIFQITEKKDIKNYNYNYALKKVSDGKYKIAVIIPAGATDSVRNKVKPMIAKFFSGETPDIHKLENSNTIEIQILTEPTLKQTFKQAILSSIREYTGKTETQILFKLLAEQIAEMTGTENKTEIKATESISFKEIFAYEKESRIIPNSTQHNVPAWTLFAMFFIVIPISGNMINERNDGSFFRLRTMPGSYFHVITSKTIIYMGVTMIQFILMLLIGIYILPLFGLPQLKLGNHIFALIMVALASGFAATGFGAAVGTVATTHEQAGVFGSVGVIIMAAIAGVWFPVYTMPKIMQDISIISPMNWGLEGFYKIFLKDYGIIEVLPQIASLILFSLTLNFLTIYYERFKRL
jgi:ABC-2 type transport system permease protein